MDKNHDSEINDILAKLKSLAGEVPVDGAKQNINTNEITETGDISDAEKSAKNEKPQSNRAKGRSSSASGNQNSKGVEVPEELDFEAALAMMLSRQLDKGSGEIEDDEPEFSPEDLEIVREGVVRPELLQGDIIIPIPTGDTPADALIAKEASPDILTPSDAEAGAIEEQNLSDDVSDDSINIDSFDNAADAHNDEGVYQQAHASEFQGPDKNDIVAETQAAEPSSGIDQEGETKNFNEPSNIAQSQKIGEVYNVKEPSDLMDAESTPQDLDYDSKTESCATAKMVDFLNVEAGDILEGDDSQSIKSGVAADNPLDEASASADSSHSEEFIGKPVGCIKATADSDDCVNENTVLSDTDASEKASIGTVLNEPNNQSSDVTNLNTCDGDDTSIDTSVEINDIEVKSESIDADTSVDVREDGFEFYTAENRIGSEAAEETLKAEQAPSELLDNSVKSHVAAAEPSERDLEVLIALGYEDEAAKLADAEKIQGIKDNLSKAKNEKNEMAARYDREVFSGEYTDHSQDEKIKAAYEGRILSTSLKLMGIVALTVIIGLLENLPHFGVRLPGPLKPADNPISYSLILLVLFIAGAAMVWREIVAGLDSIFRLEPEPHSLTAVATVANLIYCPVALITSPERAVPYNFPAALFLIFTALYELLYVLRERDAFETISSNSERYMLEQAEKNINATGSVRGKVYFLRKGRFTSEFFGRIRKVKRGVYLLNYTIIPAVTAAAVTAIITASLSESAADSVAAFMISLLICLPILIFPLTSYPQAHAARLLRRRGCALADCSGTDEYTKEKTVVFEDSLLFPARGIQTKGFKLYDGFEIYDVLIKVGSLFSAVGGPLDEIFDVSHEHYHRSKNVTLLRVERGGVEAMLDSSVHILAGSIAFLEKYGIYVRRNARDEQLAAAGDLTIIYIAIDRQPAARLYVDYRPDENFLAIIKRLAKCGTKSAIATCDPGIDEEMLKRKLGSSAEMVSIIRSSEKSDGFVRDMIDSGVVAFGEPGDIARPLYVASEMKRIRQRGLAAMMGIFIFNIILCAVLSAVGFISQLFSGIVALYLLILTLPFFVGSATIGDGTDSQSKEQNGVIN